MFSPRARSAAVSAPVPFYEKVKQAISHKISAGEWRPHDRIPSEAELVAQFGFSRMTINRALRELTRFVRGVESREAYLRRLGHQEGDREDAASVPDLPDRGHSA